MSVSFRSQATVFLAGAITFLMWSSTGNGQAPLPSVRKNASTPAAASDLKSLQQAMKIMRSLKCTDPTSWYYQGGMHWVPDDASDESNLKAGNPFCSSYNGTATQLMEAWDNCTHGSNPEIHFLVWHRLYIYYLENIVRDKSGNPSFSLPYWDYCDPQYRVMPAIFRDPSSSLYEVARYAPLNAGQAIEPGMDQSLNITKLMQNKKYALFNGQIDQAPHGAMHGYIGAGLNDAQMPNGIYQTTTNGLMALVPSAAFDPIFWVHHANIDYIWQNWMNSPNGAKPDLAQLEANPTNYAFFSPDGTEVKLTIAEAYKMAFSLPVTYQTTSTATGAPLAAGSGSEGVRIAQLAAPQAVREIDSPVSLKLGMVEDAAGHLEELQGQKGKRAILHLLVSFRKEPKGLFEVYIRNSEDKKIEHPDQLAGVLTFFGAKHHAMGHAKDGERDPEGKLTKEFRFDISDEIDVKSFDGRLDLYIKSQGGGDEKEKEQLTIEQVNVESW